MRDEHINGAVPRMLFKVAVLAKTCEADKAETHFSGDKDQPIATGSS
jgi:hypothetical protein